MRALAVLLALIVFTATTAWSPASRAASIDRSAVRKVIAKEKKKLIRCYSKLLTYAGPREGRVVMGFVIQKNGSTRSVRLIEDEIRDEKFAKCLGTVFEGLRFGKLPGEARISYPMVFKTK